MAPPHLADDTYHVVHADDTYHVVHDLMGGITHRLAHLFTYANTRTAATSCGLYLAVPLPYTGRPRMLGTCAVTVTCMGCAARTVDDDRTLRATLKGALFGALYGGVVRVVGWYARTPRVSIISRRFRRAFYQKVIHADRGREAPRYVRSGARIRRDYIQPCARASLRSHHAMR